MANIPQKKDHKELCSKIYSIVIENKKVIKNTLIKIFLLIISLILLIAFRDFFSLSVFQNISQDYLGSYDMVVFTYWGIMSDVLFVWIYFSINIIIIGYKKFVQNFWVEITILLIFSVIIFGLLFLTGFTSHNLSSILRDSKIGTVLGEMNCTDTSGGHFLVNNVVTCTIKSLELKNFTSNITFTFQNGTSSIISMNNSISFVSPYDSKRIYFEIFGFDKTGKPINLSTARDFEFYTQDQYGQKKAQFITYSIAVVGIVLYYIPGMVANFKKIFNKE